MQPICSLYAAYIHVLAVHAVVGADSGGARRAGRREDGARMQGARHAGLLCSKEESERIPHAVCERVCVLMSFFQRVRVY